MGTGSKRLFVVLFYSSMLHVGWVFASYSVQYFLLYCVVTAPVLLGKNVSILMLNLAGLPPLTGFMIKLSVLQLIPRGLCILALFLSLVILYSYLRIFVRGEKNLEATTAIACRLGLAF